MKDKFDFLQKLTKHLDIGKLANCYEISGTKEKIFLNDLHLLTSKPMLYVANTSENMIDNKQYVEKLKEFKKDRLVIPICSEMEAQMASMAEEEKKDFRKDAGIVNFEMSALDILIKSSFDMLNLITFFTVGEEECRSWPLPKNSTAPKAGSTIHSDFENFFVKAEVTKYEEFIKNYPKKLKTSAEGKTYIVQDGDIILFKSRK